MLLRYQGGALSLRWAVFIVSLCAFSGMAALYAMRYQRNLFDESWRGIKASVVKELPADIRLPEPAQASESVIRRCTVDGKVMYSNIECKEKDRNSRIVELHYSKGLGGEQPLPDRPAETRQTGANKLPEP